LAAEVIEHVIYSLLMRRSHRQLATFMAVAAVIALLSFSGSLWLTWTLIPQLFVLFLVPVVVGTFLWFIWHLFVYKYWRANHIRQMKERRELRDATLR
jgi:hypothetical protein